MMGVRACLLLLLVTVPAAADEPRRVIGLPGAPGWGVALSVTGDRALISEGEGQGSAKVQLIDLANGTVLKNFARTDLQGANSTAGIALCGNLVLHGGADGFGVWDLDKGAPRGRIAKGEARRGAFTADCAKALVVADEQVEVWELSQRRKVASTRPPAQSFLADAMRYRAVRSIVASDKYRWTITNGPTEKEETAVFDGVLKPGGAPLVSPQGSLQLGKDGILTWRPKGRAPVSMRGVGVVFAMGVTDQSIVTMASADIMSGVSAVHRWSIGKPDMTEGGTFSEFLSGDGQRGLVFRDGVLQVIEVASGKTIAKLAAVHPRDAALDGSGKHVITSVRDGSYQIWDVETSRSTTLVRDDKGWTLIRSQADKATTP